MSNNENNYNIVSIDGSDLNDNEPSGWHESQQQAVELAQEYADATGLSAIIKQELADIATRGISDEQYAEELQSGLATLPEYAGIEHDGRFVTAIVAYLEMEREWFASQANEKTSEAE